MTGFRDHFSGHAAEYARYRPGYPPELFGYLAQVAATRGLAWDVGTGSGQVAVGLAERFQRVIATDASRSQVSHAQRRDNIQYLVARAEDRALAAGTVDLVTVGQALHWIDAPDFYSVVRCVAKPGGIVAVWGYDWARVCPEIDGLIVTLYAEILDGCWPPERRLVDEHYAGVPFPFDQLESPHFVMRACWDLDRFLNYLGTWSAVRRYWERNGTDPVVRIRYEITAAWGSAAMRRVTWPMFIRVGKVFP